MPTFVTTIVTGQRGRQGEIMTFVTIVPCAHVIGTESQRFFYCDRSLRHARKGHW